MDFDTTRSKYFDFNASEKPEGLEKLFPSLDFDIIFLCQLFIFFV